MVVFEPVPSGCVVSPLSTRRLETDSSPHPGYSDPSVTIRTKTAFLLSQLVSQAADPSALVGSLRSSTILSTLLASLSLASALPSGPNGDSDAIDPDYRDKALRVLLNAVQRTAGAKGLEEDEKKAVRLVLGEVESDKSWSATEDLGVSADEWSEFKQAVAA